MKYSFFINSETPAKKNSRIVNRKTGRNFPSKRYQEWHQLAMLELNRQKKPDAPIKHCHISLTFIHGDLRRRDSDNGCSSIMDLLVDERIIEDDNWKVVEKINIENGYCKGKPKCLIFIEELS